MIDITLDPASVERADTYLENAKARILQGVRVGMKEAMVELAATEESKLHGDPIHTRTGRLASALLKNIRVIETETTIRGMVSSNVGGLPLGGWLESGVHEPAVSKTLLHFVAGGEDVFSRGHKQFYEMGKPWQMPSLEESKGKILETIRAHAMEAMGE